MREKLLIEWYGTDHPTEAYLGAGIIYSAEGERSA